MVDAVEVAKQAGLTGRDVRHIPVRVMPEVRLDGGKLVEGYKAYIGDDHGDLVSYFPGDICFISITPGWKFASFALDGETHAGACVCPTDGDYSARFSNDTAKAVIVENKGKTRFAYRYQLVLVHEQTGALAITDPTAENGDRQDGPNSGGSGAGGGAGSGSGGTTN